MKVGDMVRPHAGIRHDRSKQHLHAWVGIVLELHARERPMAGSRQAAVVCWNYPGFQEELQWTYQLEVVSESR